MIKESSKTKEELELEQKLKAMEKELEHEKLPTRALNTLIDTADCSGCLGSSLFDFSDGE
jgi:hypothetical protein